VSNTTAGSPLSFLLRLALFRIIGFGIGILFPLNFYFLWNDYVERLIEREETCHNVETDTGINASNDSPTSRNQRDK
jgi:hypothetical protein